MHTPHNKKTEILYEWESVSDMTAADSKGILYISICESLWWHGINQ